MKSEMALAAASAAAQNMPNKPLYGCQVINGVPPPTMGYQRGGGQMRLGCLSKSLTYS